MNQKFYDFFLLPLRFQSLSFHHKGYYSITISTNASISSSRIVLASHKSQLAIIDQNGNITGISLSLSPDNRFKSEKFQIEFNEQTVDLCQGIRIAMEVNNTAELLIQLEMHDENNRDKSIVVSSETLFINAELNSQNQEPFCVRRIFFPTGQFFATLDIACTWTNAWQILPPNCCFLQKNETQSDQYVKLFYTHAVQKRLFMYAKLSTILTKLITQYRIPMNQDEISVKFQHEFVTPQVISLEHVGVKEEIVKQQGQGMKSQAFLAAQPISLKTLLCEYYECKGQNLLAMIVQQGQQIHLNITNAFNRVNKLMMAVGGQWTKSLCTIQLKRVLTLIEKLEGKNRDQILSCSKKTFQPRLKQVLKESISYVQAQTNPPILQVTGQRQASHLLNQSKTLTILIHGFKGSQFDLSKIKIYLTQLLGFSHFYSIKGLSTAEQEGIDRLGKIAADEIATYLNANQQFEKINVIGFSLGGVIGRAMLKHLHKYSEKFHLLMTIASPHLGMKELPSCLVRTGLFFMRRVTKITLIQELNNERTEGEIRKLYELSKCPCIGWFSWVIFLGSPEDEYVPSYSSMCAYEGNDQLVKEMIASIDKKAQKIIRVKTVVQGQESFLDKVTRRRSHVCMLEEDGFLRYVFVRLGRYFLYE